MSPTPAADPVVLEGVRRRYGRVVAVDGVSLRVGRAEMFGLIGPDGAGKSTLLRMIVGLLAPSEGRIETCGLDPARRKRLARRIGYLAQPFSLYGDLTIDENIAFFARIQGVEGWKERRDQLLEWSRLAPFRGRLGDRLSGGMKQKLALTCTLIHTPELLVLDEPTTGVDPVSRRDFWQLLAGLVRDGLTIVMSTPYLDEAERCSRIALVDSGRILGLDTPDAMRASLGGGWYELIATPRRQAEALLESLAGAREVEGFGERLHFRLDPGTGVESVRKALAAAGLEVRDLRPVAASLEDVFLARLRALRSETGEAIGAAATE